MVNFKYGLECMATDRITGFAGIIVGRCDYLNGKKSYLIQPIGDGQANKMHDSEWVDEGRLSVK